MRAAEKVTGDGCCCVPGIVAARRGRWRKKRMQRQGMSRPTMLVGEARGEPQSQTKDGNVPGTRMRPDLRGGGRSSIFPDQWLRQPCGFGSTAWWEIIRPPRPFIDITVCRIGAFVFGLHSNNRF